LERELEQRMMMKKVHAVVALIGLALAVGAAWWLQRAGAGADAPRAALRSEGTAAGGGGPVAVEVARAQATTLYDDAQAVGSLRPRQGVMLRPEVSGRVAKIAFADGQKVRQGQLLVQLDDTLQQAQLKQAQAQASIARTNLQRNRELVTQGFVSQSAVDQSAAALEVAEAQVALAQAQLVRMRIVAPFDGIAGIRLVSLGDYVKDGADLVGIEDVASVLVDFRLPERVLSRLKVGQEVEVTLDGMPGRQFQGRVDAVDSQVDANGRSLLVRARLPNADGVLRGGMFARARIVFAVRPNAVVVPEEALVPQGGRQYVLKVVDGADGKVTQRIEARIGLRVPGRVEIVEGLRDGDVVVTAGQSRVSRDATPVRVVEVGPADAAAAAAAPAPQAAR
jgi:membrane fusion protein (multidrug efflux system)